MTKEQYREEAGRYRCNRCKHVCDGPHCDNCDPEDGDAALPKCIKCNADCEAQTDAQREMDTCSDECLIDAIGDMFRENQRLKRNSAEMAEALRRIRDIRPPFDEYAERGSAYAYALGTIEGIAIVGLSCEPRSTHRRRI